MKQYNEQNLEKKVKLSKIAIDMHLKSFRVVRQMDHGPVQPAQRFEPVRFYQWLEKEKSKAERVAVSYEAGCFGYEPARRMQAKGIEVYVIAPQNWDEQGKRQVNDKWDAAVMCRRLSDYLDGHGKALSVVHIPSREEEEERSAARFREQLAKEIRRIGAMGAQPLATERNGGARPVVAGRHLAENQPGDASLGNASTGNLESIARAAGKTHRKRRERTPRCSRSGAVALWRRRTDPCSARTRTDGSKEV